MSQKTLCSSDVPREVLAGALQAGYGDVYSPPRSRVLDKHGPEGDSCSGKHLEMFPWCRALLRTNKRAWSTSDFCLREEIILPPKHLPIIAVI